MGGIIWGKERTILKSTKWKATLITRARQVRELKSKQGNKTEANTGDMIAQRMKDTKNIAEAMRGQSMESIKDQVETENMENTVVGMEVTVVEIITYTCFGILGRGL
ncbi:MAG: hypothetical protein R6U44_03410 [Archaeoglobaceae archaeon]